MGCLMGVWRCRHWGGVNSPCGWYCVRGQLPSTGGREHTHTHTHKNESPFPHWDPRMKMGLGTSSNGKGESLFCGWKNSMKKFEHVLRLCKWKSCFLVKKINFLAKNTDFPVKNPIFLSKTSIFLTILPLSCACLILARRIDMSPCPYGDRFSH
jgi:hypothetical protein